MRPLAEQLGSTRLIDCDVSDMTALDTAFEELAKDWPTIDFVVHAIGFSDKNELRGRFMDTSLDNFLTTMNISVYSFVAVAQRAAAMMPDGGSLLTLSYYGAEKVIPHYNVMGVAKAALETSVQYLAVDLGRDNIRVNAISAGPIKTLAASGIGDFRLILKWNELNSPLKRNVTIEDVGGAGLYLLKRSRQRRDGRGAPCRCRLSRDRHEGRGRAGYRAGVTMVVRPARPADAGAIDALLRTAFPGEDEAQLVEAIEADGDVLLPLVAEEDGAVVGYILFSRMDVVADEAFLPAAGLAPVATAPDRQRAGIGSALIRTGLERLREKGIALCFVLGDPGYYERFGSRAGTAAPFASPYAGAHFMALFLDSGRERPESGRARYAPPLDGSRNNELQQLRSCLSVHDLGNRMGPPSARWSMAARRG